MSETINNTNIQNHYLKNNQIRTKLLKFIDNEIKSKMQQKIKTIKFKCEDESQIKISFEETFAQKQTNRYAFFSSNINKIKKNDNADKSISTVDDSSNKIHKKVYQKRLNIRSKTISKVDNRSKKLLNNNNDFHKNIYSINNLSKQKNTFLIVPKKQNPAEYLKILCNNLKRPKNNKKPTIRITSRFIKSKLLDLNKDKKSSKKSSKLKLKKPKKENRYADFSLRKQKKNFVVNSKSEIFSNSIFIKIKQKK